MTHHFGVRSVDEHDGGDLYCRLLRRRCRCMSGALGTSGTAPLSPSKDEDIEYQSRLLGTAPSR